MSYEILEPSALDYYPCRYGTSKLVFRGPGRDLGAPYVAFIGGTNTFGKFIEQPFPIKVEHLTGVTSVNFGQVNAGLDVFSRDTVVLEAARRARVTVMEVLGAANLSNRLYTVHARRNDRFVRASTELQKLYPKTDFSQFNFTQHMLLHLFNEDAERFAILRRSLQRVWARRMRQLLGQLGPKVVLVRIAVRDRNSWSPGGGGPGPVMVTDDMLAQLRPSVSAVLDVAVDAPADDEGHEGLVFSRLDAAAARTVAPPGAHAAVALALRPILDRLM